LADRNTLQNRKMINDLVEYIGKYDGPPLRIMEVCGTHTMSIYRWGIKKILPASIRLISGPGCPVCVTDSSVLGQAFSLAEKENVIFTCFGDMMRVPAGGVSLRDMAGTADIRIVLSPLDALDMAKTEPMRQVVFFGIGFETTAPLTAATLLKAKEEGIHNFSVLCAHKTMPDAITLLLQGGKIDALLCPGHVAAVMGAESFSFIPRELGRTAAVSGFEPADILLAIAHICADAKCGTVQLHNCYPRVVSANGNKVAQHMMEQVFMPCDAIWRGLGDIPKSGLALRPEFADLDAAKRFDISDKMLIGDERCCCGNILAGEMQPFECPLFGDKCTPNTPVGACMVSSEGACAAAYKYGGRSNNGK